MVSCQKGPTHCLRMADRALLTGYLRVLVWLRGYPAKTWAYNGALFTISIKATRHDFSTSRHSAQFHTRVTLEQRPFTLMKPSCQHLLQTCKKLVQNSHTPTYQLRPDLGDMTHFQDGPRFCEMKTVRVHKPHMYSAKLTGSSVPCWPCPEPSHYGLLSAVFH